MSISGWFYLHKNSELIYKSDPDAIADIRDSDFARCSWPMDISDRKSAWELLVEALALGARESRVHELAGKWGCNDADADKFAEVVGITIERDGNSWCAHKNDFIDLQSSPAGYGESKLESMADLAKSLGIESGHMWRKTFSDLVSS